jgi:hypothetical protein
MVKEPSAHQVARLQVGTRDGLPGWVIVTLDAVLASGVIRTEALDGKISDELTALASDHVRRAFG